MRNLDRQSKTALAIAAATLIVGGVALARIGGDLVGLVCAALLIFVLPGLAVACANPVKARVGERHAVAIAFGIAATILGTVALDALGLKLDSKLWILLLVFVSLVACIGSFALFPENRGDRAEPRPAWRQGDWRPRALRDISLGILAACLLAAAALVTFSSNRDQANRETFTQLWVVPSLGQAGSTAQVTVGLHNRTIESRDFTVQAFAGERSFKTWSGVNLAPGQEWSKQISTPPGAGRIRIVADGGGYDQRSVGLTLR